MSPMALTSPVTRVPRSPVCSREWNEIESRCRLRVDREPQLVDDALAGKLEPQVRLVGRDRLGRGDREHRKADVGDRV